MVATMVIEVALALYTLWRYKLSVAVRLIVALLICLATFQLAEFYVCTGYVGHQIGWSRFGFVAISFLPPLGLHLAHVLAGKAKRKLVGTAYITMVAFIAFFLTSNAFTGHQCTGNYVIFQFTAKVTGVYSLYYFGWILAGLGLGVKWAKQLKAKGAEFYKQFQAVRGLIAGYLIFLVPSALTMIIKPSTDRGIPSILCGFAILLALTLGFYVLPRAAESKKRS
jgi:hypothetical protein